MNAKPMKKATSRGSSSVATPARRKPGAAAAKKEIEALAELADTEIDTSDVPEVTDWTGAKRGLFYRPNKKQLTLRLDEDVIAWFRANAPDGRRYQTFINEALRRFVAAKEKSVGSVPSRRRRA